jgi:predicted ferric reductase
MSVRGLLWLSLYLTLITLPLGVATIWPGEFADIPTLMKVGVAFGFLAFTILGLEFSLISKIQSVASAFGMDALILFHRQMGLVATILVIAHTVVLVYNGYPIQWLNPFGPAWFRRRLRSSAVHAEVQSPRKSAGNHIVANDDNYALAA